jgi:hypothetical protein
MIGMRQETLQSLTAFAKSYDARSRPLCQIPVRGLSMAAALDATYSRGTPSVWCTSFGAMTSRLSPSLTVVAAPATGGRDSDPPSTFRMQRTALRAAADPRR